PSLLPSLALPRTSGSVILDDQCSKRYGGLDALADAAREPAAHADPAPRWRLAQAPADGRCPAAERRLDSARNSGDHGVVPVARARNSIVPWRGHVAARRSDRNDVRRRDRRPLPQSPER